MVKGQTTEVSGEPALQLQDTGDSGTLDVSDSAVPRILETLSGAQYGF